MASTQITTPVGLTLGPPGPTSFPTLMRRAARLCCVAALLVSIASCGDDTTADEAELSAAESALVGTWKQTNSESRVGTEPWVVSDDADCRIDNTEQYDADGTWAWFDGPVQCGGGGTGVLGGTWRLAASDTKVVYTYEGAAGEYESTVETLTETEMVLTFSTGQIDGLQTRYTFTKQ